MPPVQSRTRGRLRRTAALTSHSIDGQAGLVDAIGGRIARERALHGLSIDELAQRAGISNGLLSQIERGIGNPSLSTLVGLANALDMPLGAFFAGAADESDIVVRAQSRKHLVLSDHRLVYELLVPDLQGRLSMLHIELPPGFSNQEKPFAHAGEECELVLEGHVDAYIGERNFSLGPGDSIRFNSAIPHWFRTFETKVVIISAMTPPSF
jgi:transcriptional regulator with XRE-family HTH domain